MGAEGLTSWLRFNAMYAKAATMGATAIIKATGLQRGFESINGWMPRWDYAPKAA